MGERRNAELSRAAILAAAGGALIAMSQRASEVAYGPAGKAILVAGGAVIVVALVLAVRSLIGRSGGADQ